MRIGGASKSRIREIAVILLLIGLVAIILVWQFHLAYLRRTLVDRSLMTDIPCAAPCWQGIVPGETSLSQAMQILEDSPYIKEGSLQEAGTSEIGGVMWWWCAPGRRLKSSISWRGDVVQEITLGLTYDLSVDQVVSKFGPPEAIDIGKGGVPEHGYWIINLYYPGVGIQFKAYTPEFEDLLEPSTAVEVVQFFVSSSLEKRVEDVFGGDGYGAEYAVSHRMGLMRPWQGYGDLFEIYYESPHDLEW